MAKHFYIAINIPYCCKRGKYLVFYKKLPNKNGKNNLQTFYQMTAQEKSSIYNLLRVSASFECGYTPAVFQREITFNDDIVQVSPPTEKAPASENNEPKKAQIQEKPSENISAVSQEKTHNEMNTLEDVVSRVLVCHDCRLADKRTHAVPGEGVENPLVLVVGEGPGHDEDVTGRPFVGAAGQLLDKMLGAIQLSRHTNCFIANVVKCRPPANRTPLPDEATICRKYLEVQIRILKPKAILAMGNTALLSLLGRTGITRLHGVFGEAYGIPVMPTFHPSALLRDVSKKRPAWEDLKLFRKRLIEIAGDYTNGAYKMQ